MNIACFLGRPPQNGQPAAYGAFAAFGLGVLCLAGPAFGQRLPITPGNSQVGYTVFGLGLVPIHGAFQQFSGAAVLSAAHPTACDVDVTIQVASLRMASPYRQHQALGPDILAASRYPTMRFTGKCQPSGIVGSLTMHGVTQPLVLLLHRTSTGLTATAALRRQDYGIDGLPHLVGSQVRIRLTTPVPETFRAAAPAAGQ